jgi:hypothetical protein
MKPRLIFLFVIMFSLSAKAQNFWEPLDGPYGGDNINYILCGNKLAFCVSTAGWPVKLYKINVKELSLIDNPIFQGHFPMNHAYVSKMDYLWVSISGPIPQDYYLSLDGGLTFDFCEGSGHNPMAENSKHDLYYASSSLFKSSNQINWDIVVENITTNFSYRVFINNQDEIVLIGQYSDTINIKKLDPITYKELFNKKIQIKRVFNNLLISTDDSYYIMSDSSVYHSIDEGTSFTKILTASNGRAFREILELNNMLFIATNQGVMTSADKGATWTDVNTGLNSFDCRSIGKTGDNTLYLGLTGDVVYRSVKYTSVDEETTVEEIVCTPNPVTDFIEISVGTRRAVSDLSDVRIYNFLGEIQTTPSLLDTPPWKGGERVRIDVSGLAPGMYFVRFGDIVGKFVKL